jgi:hypothetical protein
VDYRSSQIGEDHGDGRSSDLLTEVDNANADEWKLRLFLHGLLPLKIVVLICLITINLLSRPALFCRLCTVQRRGISWFGVGNAMQTLCDRSHGFVISSVRATR